jgi:hypothetical protein
MRRAAQPMNAFRHLAPGLGAMRIAIGLLAIVAVAAGACGNPREEARNELRELYAAVDQHARVHRAYPLTIDPERAASATNLPPRARAGVRVELVHAGADGFQAVARRAPWVCSMNVDATRHQRLKCAPLSNAEPEAGADSAARPVSPLETRP